MKAKNILLLTLIGITSTMAQYVPKPADKLIKYSPYPEQKFPNQVFFGDTHLHTSYSTDAGMIGNTLGPEEAYRFARGEKVTSSTGLPAQLKRPLDFLVVSDHAENLGLAPAINESNPELLKNEWAKMVHDLVKAGKPTEAYDKWLKVMGVQKDPLKEQTEFVKLMWHRITEAAKKYNNPGQFTAFIAYEWTTNYDGGDNLHRNVIFRGDKTKADQMIPFSQYDSVDPEDLWQWMADYEKKTGGQVLAIPHNGNLSNGLMFDDVTLTTKKPLSRDYAERRMKWEPLYEITQMKGDGESHPSLSPTDEFADFEIWDKGSFGPKLKTKEMIPKEYAREALKRGLAYESKLGMNPFKFGFAGGTDSHTSLSTTSEDNFFGKVVLLEPTDDPIRFDEVIAGRFSPKGFQNRSRNTGAAGITGIWAKENTREALWDAMKRKEVFATTGTRLKVRVFGGFDYISSDLDRSDFVKYAYEHGMPMGGDLSNAPKGKAPNFLVRVVRDADGANLDRVQIVKGWLDKSGKTHEKIYDLAVSDDRKIGSDGRCKTLVGNTVNVKEATYTNTIGTPFLQAYWSDPEFDPTIKAFYYVRALEIPTPRWTTYDAKIFGVKLPTDVPSSIQERAYTSPIWYTPSEN